MSGIAFSSAIKANAGIKPGAIKREVRRLERAMLTNDVQTLREAQAHAGIAPQSRRTPLTEAIRESLGYG